MSKKLFLLTLVTVFAFTLVTFADVPKTALDYATISQEEWAEINAQNEIEESLRKESNKMEARQRNKDKYSGPGALESSANYVANPNTTEYFSNTVAPVEGQGEFIELVDPKYGITFKSKKYFNTNLGEFNLLDAAFEPEEDNYYSNYQFRLTVGKTNQKIKTSYRVFIKAYNAAGQFVDYSYTMFSPDVATVSRDVYLHLFKNNERQVARIEFGLDTTGMDAAVIAKNVTSQYNFGYPDLFVRFADTTNPFPEDKKAETLETYNKEYEKELKEAEKEVAYVNNIHEIS